MSDLLFKSAKIAGKGLSALELMRASLERIDAVNGSVNAIVSLRDRDACLADARAAGASPSKGPLHGLPIAIKKLANAKGLLSSMGSPICQGQYRPKR